MKKFAVHPGYSRGVNVAASIIARNYRLPPRSYILWSREEDIKFNGDIADQYIHLYLREDYNDWMYEVLTIEQFTEFLNKYAGHSREGIIARMFNYIESRLRELR